MVNTALLNLPNQQKDDWHRAFVALGSNLDQPASQLKNAINYLAQQSAIRLIKSSSLYQSKAVGYSEQPDFINAVVEISTSLEPFALLDLLLGIEQHFHRVRSFKNAPRTLDLDLLIYGNQCDRISNSEQLTLPHPRLHLRTFVLVPLLEIAKDITVPNLGKLNQYLNQLIAKDNDMPMIIK